MENKQSKKPKNLKIFIFAIAISLLVCSIFFASWRKQKIAEERFNEEFLKATAKVECTSDDSEKECVEKLVRKAMPPELLESDGSHSHFSLSFGDEVYDAEERLINMGEPIVPILIDFTKKTSDDIHKQTAIYILGEIGGKEANEFLKSILNSKTENGASKYWAREGIRIQAQEVDFEPLYVYTNNPTQVTIRSKIKDSDFIKENVYLYRCIQGGLLAGNVGRRMFDDKTHGDDVAGDNIFTTQITINETKPRKLQFRVVLDPSGIQSEIVDINVIKEIPYEEAREKIITDIEAGNIEDLQRKGIISERNKIFLMSLTDEKKEQFIKRAKEAKLIKEIGDMKIYRYSWIDDEGDENFIESWMGLNSKGDWTFQF